MSDTVSDTRSYSFTLINLPVFCSDQYFTDGQIVGGPLLTPPPSSAKYLEGRCVWQCGDLENGTYVEHRRPCRDWQGQEKRFIVSTLAPDFEVAFLHLKSLQRSIC
jgi:hypothetical protein